MVVWDSFADTKAQSPLEGVSNQNAPDFDNDCWNTITREDKLHKFILGQFDFLKVKSVTHEVSVEVKVDFPVHIGLKDGRDVLVVVLEFIVQFLGFRVLLLFVFTSFFLPLLLLVERQVLDEYPDLLIKVWPIYETACGLSYLDVPLYLINL